MSLTREHSESNLIRTLIFPEGIFSALLSFKGGLSFRKYNKNEKKVMTLEKKSQTVHTLVYLEQAE